MRQSRTRKLFGLASIVVLAATTAGCGQARTAKVYAAGPAVTCVEVERPERRTIRRSTEQPGQIEAYEMTSIYAKVSGYVQKWNVDIGTKVTRAQVLALLSDPELDAEADQKQALVEEAEAKLAQAKASQEVAQANLASARTKLTEVQAGIKRVDGDLARWQAELNRVEQLVAERAVTPSLLDETRGKFRSSESSREEGYAQVKTAEVAVLQGQAMLETARSDVLLAAATIKVARFEAQRVEAMRGYTSIVAPYDGVVTRRNVDVGDLTTPGTGGQALFTVARDDVVRVTVSVPEMYAIEVDPGDRALIHLQAIAGKDFIGKVTRTSWTLDAKNRTLRTEIDVPNPKGRLRPGLYANVTIVVEEHADVLTIPTTAVVRDSGKDSCIIVENGKAVRRAIKTGFTDGARTEILAGLTESEDVVKANLGSLVDGQAVEIARSPAR